MRKILFLWLLLVCVISIFPGCSWLSSLLVADERVMYDGRVYTVVENVEVDLKKGTDSIMTPIGSLRSGNTVFKIDGLPVNDWIYISWEPNGLYRLGLYKCEELRMDSLEGFNPTKVEIDGERCCEIDDQGVITELVNSIEHGIEVLDSEIAFITPMYVYKASFYSNNFPNLVYEYTLSVNDKQEYYVSARHRGGYTKIDNVFEEYVK
ncbi:MAG: hypothetical protein FWG40_08590 [Peptococcaceae bacterium]|nr:hypothetical protein [Peptococcaceae bacterium]